MDNVVCFHPSIFNLFLRIAIKSSLNVYFVLDVFTTCCILQNMFKLQIVAFIQWLMKIIEEQDVQENLDEDMVEKFNVDL
jgi:hypothetical protein